MEEDSYSNALSKILHDGRGPLNQIEEFDTPIPPEDSKENTEQVIEKTDTIITDNGRSELRRIAALMAVITMQTDAPDSQSKIGRQLGSAWAQAHRRSAMGLPNLTFSRSKRSTWR